MQPHIPCRTVMKRRSFASAEKLVKLVFCFTLQARRKTLSVTLCYPKMTSRDRIKESAVVSRGLLALFKDQPQTVPHTESTPVEEGNEFMSQWIHQSFTMFFVGEPQEPSW